MSATGPPLIDINIPPPPPSGATGATYDATTNTFKVSVPAPALTDADPHQTALLQAEGWKDSGWIERFVVALYSGAVKMVSVLIALFFDGIDLLLSQLAQFMTAAQAKNTPDFWVFVGSLIEDLLGIHVDGLALYQTMQTRGTIGVMRATGATLIDTLIGEFTGTLQGTGGSITGVSAGTGIGGLPAVQLTPAGGLNAARTFMGFVLSFAVREGNTDLFADMLPLGIGQGFKDFAEAMAKNLGLGRMSRLALRPILQELIGVPLGWALKSQYRTTLLNPEQAMKAFEDGVFTSADLDNEFALHGYSAQRQAALKASRSRPPSERVLYDALVDGSIDESAYQAGLARHGYSAADVPLVENQTKHDFRRQLSRSLVNHAMQRFMAGEAQLSDVDFVINGGDFSNEEKSDLHGYAVSLSVIPRRQLGLAQWEKALQLGVANIADLQDFLDRAGYRPQDIAVINQLALLAIKGPKHKHATIAQWLKAIAAGTVTLADYDAFLSAQGYNAEDQVILHQLGVNAAPTGAGAGG